MAHFLAGAVGHDLPGFGNEPEGDSRKQDTISLFSPEFIPSLTPCLSSRFPSGQSTGHENFQQTVASKRGQGPRTHQVSHSNHATLAPRGVLRVPAPKPPQNLPRSVSPSRSPPVGLPVGPPPPAVGPGRSWRWRWR